MKKLLLSLITILIVNLSFSQIQIPPPPPGISGISECDPDQDGIATYDLTSYDTFFYLDPNDYFTPTYHRSQEDANLNINPITNPENFTNDLFLEYIWTRAEPKDLNGQVILDQFYLETRFLNYSYEIGEVVQCSQYFGPSCFNLLDTYVIACGSLDLDAFNFQFYNTLDDYNNQINSIGSPGTYFAEQMQETIYVRAVSLVSGKTETTSFDIRTIEPPAIIADLEPYTQIDDNGDGIETFDLSSHNITVGGEGMVHDFFRYFLSEEDLLNDVNMISNPYAFRNTTNPQTIFVRLDNTENYPGCYETQYCYGYDSFQILVESCQDLDGDQICDFEDSCPTLDNRLIGSLCDDGDPCTENDIYTEACECEGTLVDSDSDGVCDAQDICPGGDDTIDNDQDGVPDDCQPICVDRTDSFGIGSLTHTGEGSTTIDFVFPLDSQDVTFSISELNDKLKGKPDNQFIEEVTIKWTDENDVTRIASVVDATQGQSIPSIFISGIVKNISVTLSDGQDGNSGSSTMQITLGDLYYCTLEYPCLPDSDGDGICDTEDQCPDFNDSLIGTSCDDGDSCTTGDVYQIDCGCAGIYTDADNDGLCIGDDPNDNDACVPDPSSANCTPCRDILIDDFEIGFGNWIDGGKDVFIENSNVIHGSASVRLRDNSGTSSSIYTQILDLSRNSEIYINFFYRTKSMDPNDSFALEVSEDGGSTFNLVKHYESEIDFINELDYAESINLPGPLSPTSVLRLRCEGSSKKSMLIVDDIVVSTCGIINSIAKRSTHALTKPQASQIEIFPNPAVSEITISGLGEKNTLISFRNMVGQVVLRKNLSATIRGSHQIDVGNLSTGIYLLHITDKEGTVNQQHKLVIKR